VMTAGPGIGDQILPLRTPEAILFFFVNESVTQVFAVADTSAPERNEGPSVLLLQRADDVRRTAPAAAS